MTRLRMPGNWEPVRWVSLIVCLILVSIPFLSVEFAPITDLPQQASQIRLVIETLNHPDTSPYSIQWFKPGNLCYVILGLSWAIFGPLNAGRIAMLAIAMLWVISVHLIAWRRSRSPDLAVLASLFVFNQSLYWGFYSFLLGVPAFLLWFQKTTSYPTRNSPAYEAIGCIFYALCLYSCHILWFLFGLAWVMFHGVLFRRSLKAVASKLFYISPVIVLTIYWYMGFAETKMAEQSALRVDSPGAALFMAWVIESAFGGLRGPIEPAAFVAILVWTSVAILVNLRTVRNDVDWELFSAGGLLVTAAFFLPDVFMTTVLFNARWMPIGLMLLVLSMPPIALRLRVRQTASVAIFAGFCAVTTLSWMDFDRKETSGLVEALEALPSSTRVLGLATVQSSPVIKGMPSLHIAAYAQALKGCSLNFSFADFSSSLVIFKDRSEKPWTGHIEWFPERLKVSDLKYFEYALVDGFTNLHDQIVAQGNFEPVTKEGRWRLYRIIN